MTILVKHSRMRANSFKMGQSYEENTDITKFIPLCNNSWSNSNTRRMSLKTLSKIPNACKSRVEPRLSPDNAFSPSHIQMSATQLRRRCCNSHKGFLRKQWTPRPPPCSVFGSPFTGGSIESQVGSRCQWGGVRMDADAWVRDVARGIVLSLVLNPDALFKS